MFNGHPAISSTVRCLNADQKYRDHNLLNTFVKASMKKTRETPELSTIRKLLLFLCKHAVRTKYHLQFAKCMEKGCDHCSRHLIVSMKAMSFLHKYGGKLFTPTPSIVHPNHYMPFLECVTQYDLKKSLLEPHEGLQSEHCLDGCLAFCFTSAADKEKHRSVVHSIRKRAHPVECDSTAISITNEPDPKRMCCTFPGCQITFATKYQLQKHKQNVGHKLTRGRPKKN